MSDVLSRLLCEVIFCDVRVVVAGIFFIHCIPL